MKKLLTLLLAGVMTAGTVSFAACNNGEPEEEFNKIPQIPAGVTLPDVAFEDIAKKAGNVNNSRFTSKNLYAHSYVHYKSYGEGENDGHYYEDLDEHEEYLVSKYLEKDGKTYGESKRHYLEHTKKVDIEIESGKKYNNEEREDTDDSTAFLKDKTLGHISSFNVKGNYDELKPGTDENVQGEYDETVEPQLNYLYKNGEDYLRSSYYNDGIGIFGVFYMCGKVPWLAYIGGFRYCAYGTETHLNYINENDAFYLLFGCTEMEIIEHWYNNNYSINLLNYDFVMQADETKVYVKQEYKLNVLDPEGDVTTTIECTYAYYQDTASNLTEKDFEEEYINDANTADLTYLDCDTEQVAKDISAGKEVVIDYVGSGEKLADGHYTRDNGFPIAEYAYQTDLGFIGEPGYCIAGIYDYDIVDGKLVFDANKGELEEGTIAFLKQIYEGYGGNGDELDIASLKKVLIVNNTMKASGFYNNNRLFIYLD